MMEQQAASAPNETSNETSTLNQEPSPAAAAAAAAPANSVARAVPSVARAAPPDSAQMPSSAIAGVRQSGTMTLTETATETQNEIPEILALTLRARPTVRWDESVLDNEGLGRKSSKRCCIFHKQRAFGESSTDSSDYDSDRSGSSNSTASGAGGDPDNNDQKKRRPRKGGIARPKKDKSVPDYQRFHA